MPYLPHPTFHFRSAAAPFQQVARPRMIGHNPPDDLRRRSEKVSPIVQFTHSD
jgi:hypothetical protein